MKIESILFERHKDRVEVSLVRNDSEKLCLVSSNSPEARATARELAKEASDFFHAPINEVDFEPLRRYLPV